MGLTKSQTTLTNCCDEAIIKSFMQYRTLNSQCVIMVDSSSIDNKGVLGETTEILLLLSMALTIATSADPNEKTHFVAM